VRGKASKDGAMGWIFTKDQSGTVFAEASNRYFTCITSVAMTDKMDIKDCNVLRKLGVGEAFTPTCAWRPLPPWPATSKA